MVQIPLTRGRIHFVGIGGIGMSGIAEILVTMNYQVSGSDIGQNENIERLRKMGVTIDIGHKACHVTGAQAVVVSSAIRPDNSEYVEARKQRIPVVRRAEMLAELMRLRWSIAIGGTHGKTTTTSLVAHILESAGLDPTVVNGGIINAYGTNARLGKGQWLVAEADESDGTFVRLPARIAIVTNIDPEHLDFYGDFETLQKAFQTFIENIPFYGFAVLCIDHPNVQAVMGRVLDRRIITYGVSPQAEVQVQNCQHSYEGVTFNVRVRPWMKEAYTIEAIKIPIYGDHNVQNALGAIATGLEMGIEPDVIRQSLLSFGGVKRRFTKVGEIEGRTIIDDYAHHPVEISAVLKAARMATKRKVVAVVQPHRYTRLRDLFEEFSHCFNDADTVIIAPVYEAGEQPIEGVDHVHLAQRLRLWGHRHVYTVDGPQQLALEIMQHSEKGDLVIFMGAGSISRWAHDIPQQIEALVSTKKEAVE